MLSLKGKKASLPRETPSSEEIHASLSSAVRGSGVDSNKEPKSDTSIDVPDEEEKQGRIHGIRCA